MFKALNYKSKSIQLLLFAMVALLVVLNSCSRKAESGPYYYKMFSTVDKANSFVNQISLDKAIPFIDSAYNKASDLSVLDWFYNYNFKINYYIYFNKDLYKARIYVDSSFKILSGKENLYKAEFAMANFNEGDLLFAEGKFDASYESYFKGRKYAYENLEVCRYAVFTTRLALVRYKQGEYAKAIPIFKKSNEEFSYCTENADFDALFVFPQANINSIALCFEKLNNLDSAVYYYKEAIAFIDTKKDLLTTNKNFIEASKGVVYGNLGGALLQLDKYNEAEFYLKKSIDINSKPGFENEDAKTAVAKLANLYIKTKRYAEAKVLIDDLAKFINNDRTYNLSEKKLNLYNLKLNYFEGINDLEQAYIYSKKYNALNDSIFDNNQFLKNIDIDEVFKNADQKYKMEVLEKDAQLKNTYLFASIIIILMVLIILFVVYRSLSKSNKYVEELKYLNDKVNEQNIQMHYALEELEQNQLDNEKMKKIVAHDLRNPIGGMIMGVGYLNRNYPNFEGKQMLELIERSGNNSLALINDLLNFKSDYEDLQLEDVDFADIINYCVDLLRLKASSKKQKIFLSTCHVKVHVNKDKMWRVFSNLIDNAIKFSPSGSTIKIEAKVDNAALLVVVEDFGVGISDEIGDKVFDMYSSVKRAGTLGEQPFGMGLSITKRIIEAHKGSIWFENKKHESGTVFYVRLPIVTETVESN